MPFYCRLKVYEMRIELNFWLTVSTNGVSTRLCPKLNVFGLFCSGSGVFDCDCRRNFLKNGDGFYFLELQLVLIAKQCVPSPPNIIVGFGP